MEMKLIPNAVSSRFGRQLLLLQKSSPQIMFATGVIGIVGAGVLACRSTLKLSETLENYEKGAAQISHLVEVDKDYDSAAKDLAVLKTRTILNIAKLYAPAIGVAVVSIGLLTGSHVTLNRRNAGLAAAYAAVDKAFDEYRSRVRTELGQDQDDRFRYGSHTVEETVAKKDGGTKVVKHERVGPGEPSQYARFFDQLCENWKANPEYNRIFLQAQQNYANDMLRARGHVFLNEVYDMLGIERTGAGAVVGWVWGKGGDDYISFGIFDDANNDRVRDFVNGRENSILLDFNVDGVIYDLI